jgi:hypothetical protein
MTNVVGFPVADRPITESEIAKVYTELDPDEVHAQAFRDIEGRLFDCVRMARIARQEAFDRYDGDNEELVFAIGHTAEMLEALKADYYAAYEEGKPIKP